MGKSQRDKGKAGEREAAAFLRSIGFKSARRGQQFRGGGDSPDVVCVDELPNVNIEVKRVESFSIGCKALTDALSKACEDSATGEGVVLWRLNRRPWLLTFYPTGDAPMVPLTVAQDDIRHALLWLNQQLDTRAEKAKVSA